MAVSVDLITGHGETDHITSFDARAENRALFGGGKYILDNADTQYLNYAIEPSLAKITITPGSLMWSGMHIRVEEEKSTSYATPATTGEVKVWLHYMRDAETFVESVEFVTTTGADPASDLIQDNLTDEATEAYTLFCSFIHDPDTVTTTSLNTAFLHREGLDPSIRRQNTKISSMSATINQFVQEVDGKVTEFEQTMPNSVLTSLGQVKTEIGYGRIDQDFNLSEPVGNFAFILMEVGISIAAGAEKHITETRLYPSWYLTAVQTGGTIEYNLASCTENYRYAVSFGWFSDINGFNGNKFNASNIYAKKYPNSGTPTDLDQSRIYVRLYGIGRIS